MDMCVTICLASCNSHSPPPSHSHFPKQVFWGRYFQNWEEVTKREKIFNACGKDYIPKSSALKLVTHSLCVLFAQINFHCLFLPLRLYLVLFLWAQHNFNKNNEAIYLLIQIQVLFFLLHRHCTKIQAQLKVTTSLLVLILSLQRTNN